MAIVTVGIDLAKNVFAVHCADETGKPPLVRPVVKPDALLQLITKLAPYLIGIEACSGGHHWAREFAKFGHTPRKAVMSGGPSVVRSALLQRAARLAWPR